MNFAFWHSENISNRPLCALSNMPNFGLLPAIISRPKTITQWFCGMLRNLRMSQFGVRFCIGGGANFMRRLAGRRKSAVAAGPIAERCQIFSFLFARRLLKSARLVRVFFVAVRVEIAREFQTPHSFRQAPSGLPRGRKTFNMPV